MIGDGLNLRLFSSLNCSQEESEGMTHYKHSSQRGSREHEKNMISKTKSSYCHFISPAQPHHRETGWTAEQS